MNYKLNQLIRLRVITTAIVMYSTSNIATAQSISNEDFPNNCDRPVTQIELNNCAHLEYQEADLKLNQVYQQLRKKNQNTEREQQLMNTQLAWLKFRDLNCEYAASRYQGGSIQPLIYSSCLTRLTKERIQHLESYLKP
ncbi:lysozyme inhibitor LprI family protein [Hyella patelloides]|nr:lysozyme inhibitor LprI family protein [Hyella patelloides]